MAGAGGFSPGALTPPPRTRAPFWHKALSAFVGFVIPSALWYLLPNLFLDWDARHDYDWHLFVLLPLVAGFVASLVLEWREPYPWVEHMTTLLLQLVLATLILLVAAFEGLICLFMASPILFALLLIGGAVGRKLMSLRWARRNRPPLLASLAALLPVLLVSQRLVPTQPEVRTVRTEVVIDAPPERVWPLLHRLEDMHAPEELLFRVGVAHPVAVQTERPGVGAARVCRLSTGEMRERVTGWEPPRLLRFAVLDTPDTMRELNPFGEVRAEHLRGYFQCLEGEFRLERLARGRTRLEGKTVYQHRFGPAWYWSLWTDSIVRSVHQRVLGEITRRAERASR